MNSITVNGKSEAAPPGTTISAWLESRQIDLARVAIEHNGEILPPDKIRTTTLAAGDQLEIVQFVGGG